MIVVLLLPICLILLGIFFQNEDLFSPPVYLLGAATLSISCTNVNRSFLRTVGLSFNEVKISLVDRSATLLLLLIARSISNANEFYYLVAYIAGPLLGLYYSFRLVNMELIRIPASEEKLTVGKLVGESVPFAIDSVLIPLSEALTRIIILTISGAVMVAIFEIAWRVYVGGSAIVRSIRKSMLSAFSSNQFNDAELEKSLRSSSKLTYWLLPIGLFSGVIGGSLIPVVFSEDYVDSIPVFSVLLGTWAIMLIGSGYQVAVQSLQSGRRYLLLTGIGAKVQVISALFLVGEFGAMGAAISVLIGQVTMVSTSFILTLQMGPFGGSWRLLMPCSVLSTIFVSISWILEVEAWDGEFIISCISILLLIGIITGWRPEIPSMTSEN